MQIIRNKRQSSTGGAAPGQQKNKYRKRSVSDFHSLLRCCELMNCSAGNSAWEVPLMQHSGDT